MNMNQLAKKIASLEEKKSQVNIAQIKEILSCLARLIVDEPEALLALLKKGINSPPK